MTATRFSYRPPTRCASRGPRGFTLTELLVVVVILGMLAALVLGALQAGRQSAREARTRATIAKLHNIIMAQYESYRTRRVPVNTTGMTPPQAAAARLAMLRAVMRLEMPERWTDVVFDPQNPLSNNPSLGRPQPNPASVPGGMVPWPGLAQRYYRTYLRQFQQANGDFQVINENAPAECLYLIVSASPDALAQFHENEIGDTDGDGLMEFLDGWGNPIFFLRWAPGFTESDLQFAVVPPERPEADFLSDPEVQNRKMVAAVQQHDPFDPHRVDRVAWGLLPLVYSAGPDGEYGLWYEHKRANADARYMYIWNFDTYTYSCTSEVQGAPAAALGQPGADASRVLRHYDNIHNHRIEGD